MEKLWCNDSIAATASWVAPVELPEDDYVLIKPFGVFNARIPGGTVLKRIKHAWQSANTVDNADGVGEEYFAYVVLAPSNSQHWLLNRTDLANGMVQKLQGLDPIMQAAVRNGVPSDLRTFATATGLRSYLISAPNDTVEVVLSQVSIPDNVLVFPVLVPAYLWVVGRVIQKFRDIKKAVCEMGGRPWCCRQLLRKDFGAYLWDSRWSRFLLKLYVGNSQWFQVCQVFF